MPAFGHLGDDVLRALVLYVRALQGNPATAPLAGNAKRGKELFFGKAGCSGCHMMRGRGGFLGSDLSSYSRGRSPQAIRDAILFPNRDLDPRNRTVVAILPNGKAIEGLVRNEDNFSIQILTSDGVFHFLSKSALSSLTFQSVSPMPADYGIRLTFAEVDDLINYLVSVVSTDSREKHAADDANDE